MKKALISIAIVALLVAALLFGLQHRKAEAPINLDTQVPPTPDTEITFSCDGSRSVTAGFSERLVSLTLSDGRAYTLEQVESASGARYANDDETLVFWTKGDAAFFLENGDETFGDCVIENEPEAQTYRSDAYGLSFTYSEGYYLRAREAGTSERPQHAVVIVDDTDENRALLDGTATEPREGPTAITVDVYQNPDGLSPEEWAQSDTNWNVSTKETSAVTIAGRDGVSFVWDGLYRGKTAIVTTDEYAYVFSVTWQDEDDALLGEYDMLLTSISI